MRGKLHWVSYGVFRVKALFLHSNPVQFKISLCDLKENHKRILEEALRKTITGVFKLTKLESLEKI